LTEKGEQFFAAVTGDLVASRGAQPDDRRQIQVETMRLFDELGRELAGDLVLPFELSRGDEIQCLLRVPSRVPLVLQRFKDRFYGSAAPGREVVFGVGWGPLTPGLLAEATTVGQLDGPCFHRARAMLERAQKDGVWARFDGFEMEGLDLDETLDALFELMAAIRADWAPMQSYYAVEMREHVRRVDLARMEDVSPSVITKSLKTAHYDAILRGEDAATALLARLDPRTEPDGAA
jgi:hypothetical protein